MISVWELIAQLDQKLTDEGKQKARLLLNEWAINDRQLTDAEVNEAAIMLDNIVQRYSKKGTV